MDDLTLAAVLKNNEYIPPSKPPDSLSIILLICVKAIEGLVEILFSCNI